MSETISNSLERIKTWLDAEAPDVVSSFQPGATDDDVQRLESTIGSTLPTDLKDWLRIHNGGEEAGIFPSTDSLDMMAFSPMTTEEIIDSWTMLRDLIDSGEFGDRTTDADEGIRTEWWNSSWIPFASNGGGDFQCVDLAPTESGTTGQIIVAWHADTERHLVASSLADYLQTLADGLESGKYEYEEDEGIVEADE